jgi:hypothetical protein
LTFYFVSHRFSFFAMKRSASNRSLGAQSDDDEDSDSGTPWASADALRARLAQVSLGFKEGEAIQELTEARAAFKERRFEPRDDGHLYDKKTGTVVDAPPLGDAFMDEQLDRDLILAKEPNYRLAQLIAGATGRSVERIMTEASMHNQDLRFRQMEAWMNAERKRRLVSATEKEAQLKSVKAIVDERIKALVDADVRVNQYFFYANLAGELGATCLLPEASGMRSMGLLEYVVAQYRMLFHLGDEVFAAQARLVPTREPEPEARKRFSVSVLIQEIEALFFTDRPPLINAECDAFLKNTARPMLNTVKTTLTQNSNKTTQDRALGTLLAQLSFYLIMRDHVMPACTTTRRLAVTVDAKDASNTTYAIAPEPNTDADLLPSLCLRLPRFALAIYRTMKENRRATWPALAKQPAAVEDAFTTDYTHESNLYAPTLSTAETKMLEKLAVRAVPYTGRTTIHFDPDVESAHTLPYGGDKLNRPTAPDENQVTSLLRPIAKWQHYTQNAQTQLLWTAPAVRNGPNVAALLAWFISSDSDSNPARVTISDTGFWDSTSRLTRFIWSEFIFGKFQPDDQGMNWRVVVAHLLLLTFRREALAPFKLNVQFKDAFTVATLTSARVSQDDLETLQTWMSADILAIIGTKFDDVDEDVLKNAIAAIFSEVGDAYELAYEFDVATPLVADLENALAITKPYAFRETFPFIVKADEDALARVTFVMAAAVLKNTSRSGWLNRLYDMPANGRPRDPFLWHNTFRYFSDERQWAGSVITETVTTIPINGDVFNGLHRPRFSLRVAECALILTRRCTTEFWLYVYALLVELLVFSAPMGFLENIYLKPNDALFRAKGGAKIAGLANDKDAAAFVKLYGSLGDAVRTTVRQYSEPGNADQRLNTTLGKLRAAGGMLTPPLLASTIDPVLQLSELLYAHVQANGKQFHDETLQQIGQLRETLRLAEAQLRDIVGQPTGSSGMTAQQEFLRDMYVQPPEHAFSAALTGVLRLRPEIEHAMQHAMSTLRQYAPALAAIALEDVTLTPADSGFAGAFGRLVAAMLNQTELSFPHQYNTTMQHHRNPIERMNAMNELKQFAFDKQRRLLTRRDADGTRHEFPLGGVAAPMRPPFAVV